MSDMRTNADLALAIWLKQRETLEYRGLFEGRSETFITAIDAVMIETLMAALADVRGVGTC